MTVHVRPGQPWASPTVVHDNRVNALTSRLLLDEKNAIAVDNHTDDNGGSNAGATADRHDVRVLELRRRRCRPLQQIVVMRSLDGGKTWGGLVPKDNIPFPLSQKTLISGIGCQLSIGPKGEVYATWYDNQLNALMQAKSTNRGALWSLAVPIAGITGINAPFAGEAFRNLSLPSTAVDGRGTVYVVAASRDAEGMPLLGDLPGIGEKIKSGELDAGDLTGLLGGKDADAGEDEQDEGGKEVAAGGDGEGPESGSDIVLFRSTNGGRSYSRPVRVNQDPVNGDGDQFQPTVAVTPSGQVDVAFFDRRNDPSNYYIDTWLARSEDGGRTFTDRRVSQRSWDPAVAAPTSTSGKFIGDYQGLVADDDVAIPFWNDTQLAALLPSDKERSPYQEVFAARVPNGAVETPAALTRCMPRRLRIGARSIGGISLRSTRDLVGRRVGPPARTARGVLRYCVKGGGSVVVAFDGNGRVRLAATTARGHRRLAVGRGSTERALRTRFGGRLRSAGPGLLRVAGGPSRQLLFGLRRRRVTFVAVASSPLLAKRNALRTQLRRAALLPSR